MTDERILRHPNGGALKHGLEVHVSPDSYCDAHTQLGGVTSVFKSSLKGCLITHSKVFDTSAANVWLAGSDCAGSALQGVFARECILDRVIASSDGLEGILSLKDVVAENCELRGVWTLEGNARIHEGVWHRPPRFKRITGENGVDFGLSECKPGFAMLGCWCKPLRELLHAGPRLGQKRGWTGEQIQAAKEFYESLLDIPMEGVRA